MNLITLLDGKKTFIVSVATVLTGLVPLLHGHHYEVAAAFLLSGAFGASIRASVAKLEKKLPAPVQAVVNEELSKAV